MSKLFGAGRAPVALITAFCFAASTAAPPLAAQSPAAPARPAAAAPPPAAAPASPAPATTPPVDGGWPRAYAAPSGGDIVVHQPQIATWADQRRVVAYAAVAYTAKGAPKPALGTIRLEADTKVSVEHRLVAFNNMQIAESNFPTMPKDNVREVVAEIDRAMPDVERVIGLDRVLASVDRSQIMPKNVEGVKADPPIIFFSAKPAVLVNIDGEPIWSAIRENDLKFAVNTNWDLFLHDPTKVYYLLHEKSWLQASGIKGPWTAAGTLPGSFSKLPGDDNWKEVKTAVPGKKLGDDKLPQVFVSTTPAELIELAGEPKYTPVTGTSLLWVSNTESDVFSTGPKGEFYYLVAGRWFKAPSLTGPWTFATPTMPEEFKKIPLEHPRSRVLASVPGTQQAAEAVLLAQIPQTARVNVKQVQAPEVKYQGEPQFEKIEKTTVERAANTDKSILKVGDMYYLCFEGVWFMGTSPNGPWKVASKVPGEIYEIPISSPAHNVTYVTVQEDDDDDEWVTFATAAMYTGMMVAWGCAVWGSGYYYPPYYGGYYGGYPRYYGHYPTYGYRASYNPWTGAYGRGAVAYGPYGGAGVGARYNPSTGTYSRGAAAYGPYGGRAAGTAYNPRTGAYGATRQGSNVYGSWGTTSVQRGNQWATTSRYTSNVTGATTRTTRTSSGAAAATRSGYGGTSTVGRTASGNVYAGHDGNVYRQQGGSWQQYNNNGSWGSVDRPAAQGRQPASTASTASRGTYSQPGGTAARATTMDQLDRDSTARAEGSQRTRDYGSYQGGGSRSSGSTYRPSSSSYSGSSRSSGSSRGGGSRGGGGGRRR